MKRRTLFNKHLFLRRPSNPPTRTTSWKVGSSVHNRRMTADTCLFKIRKRPASFNGAVDVGLYNTGPSRYGFSRIGLATIGHTIKQFYFERTQNNSSHKPILTASASIAILFLSCPTNNLFFSSSYNNFSSAESSLIVPS